jgi:hypothetical protein
MSKLLIDLAIRRLDLCWFDRARVQEKREFEMKHLSNLTDAVRLRKLRPLR